MFAAWNVQKNGVRSLFCSSSSRTQKSRRHLWNVQSARTVSYKDIQIWEVELEPWNIQTSTSRIECNKRKQQFVNWTLHGCHTGARNSLRFLQKQLKQLRPSGPVRFPRREWGSMGRDSVDGWWFCPIIHKDWDTIPGGSINACVTY